jgi:molybdenum cofactor biosynthesis enzyme MoaA
MKKTSMFRLITSERCNARCKYCLARDTPKPGQDQPLELVEDAARLAAENGATEASVSGGEPLLDYGVREKIKICAKYFDHVNLQTNATLVREASRLKEEGVTHAIINIPSHRPEIYKELVGLEAFYLVQRNIKKLVDAEITVRLNVVIVRRVNDSKEHTEGMINFAKKVGAKEITFTELYPANDYCEENYTSLEPLREKLRELSSETIKNETANLFHIDGITIGVSACVRKFSREDREDWLKEYILTEDGKLVGDYFDQENTIMEVA